jgi:ABC-type glutathione transport system ATPase component
MREIRGNDISIIFQEPMTSLNPLHTIEAQIGEILSCTAASAGRRRGRARSELLTQVGIPDPETRLKSYPHQLSGGQRQRVMIAMALANEPDLLIADEPTTALDVTVQAQILALLAEIRSRLGMSMLFITHDLGIVRRIADVVCVMNSGKIVEQGPVEEGLHRAETCLYAGAAGGRAEARPGAAAAQRAGGDVGRQSQGLVSDQARAVALDRRPYQGGGWRQHRGPQGRDARRRRRIRLRQDHAGAGAAPADFLRRADRVPRQQHPGPALSRTCCRSAATCRSCFRTRSAR